MCSSITDGRSSVYAINFSGPRTVPCGIVAHCSWPAKVFNLSVPTWKACVHSARYEVHNFRSEPYLVFWNVVSGYRVEVCNQPYRRLYINLIRHLRSCFFCSVSLAMLLWMMAIAVSVEWYVCSKRWLTDRQKTVHFKLSVERNSDHTFNRLHSVQDDRTRLLFRFCSAIEDVHS